MCGPHITSQTDWETARNKCRKIVKRIFDQTRFPNPAVRDLLFDCYMENLSAMMLYAYSKEKDVCNYIAGIRRHVREFAAAQWRRGRRAR